MTKQRKLKKQIRARAEKTGESYTEARRQTLGKSRCVPNCVLPEGHWSDQHGSDHQSPDGTWWNTGWVRGTAARLDKMAVDHVVRHASADAADVGALWNDTSGSMSPKSERTLTVDVGDLPPDMVNTLVTKLKAQWRRVTEGVALTEAEKAEFDRQAEELALTEAARLIPKYRAEVEFVAEVKKTMKEVVLPVPRIEAPAPVQMTRYDSLSEEEQRALDEALAKQPPCTCEKDGRGCRFHHPPVVESTTPLESWTAPAGNARIESRTGTEGRTDFWLVRGTQAVYRLGYTDRDGRTVLGDEGGCTCARRDGTDSTCLFHHPRPEPIDVGKKLVERAYQEQVERLQRGESGEVSVTVNGSPFTVERRVTYEAVCARAKLNPSLNPSVTYRGKRELKPWETGRKFNDPVTPEPNWVRVEGILSPGKSVDAEPGMVFNAVYTGNA